MQCGMRGGKALHIAAIYILWIRIAWEIDHGITQAKYHTEDTCECIEVIGHFCVTFIIHNEGKFLDI